MTIKGSKYRLHLEIGSDSPYGSCFTIMQRGKRGSIQLGKKATEENAEDILTHETLHIVINRLRRQNVIEMNGVDYMNDMGAELLNLIMMDKVPYSKKGGGYKSVAARFFKRYDKRWGTKKGK